MVSEDLVQRTALQQKRSARRQRKKDAAREKVELEALYQDLFTDSDDEEGEESEFDLGNEFDLDKRTYKRLGKFRAEQEQKERLWAQRNADLIQDPSAWLSHGFRGDEGDVPNHKRQSPWSSPFPRMLDFGNTSQVQLVKAPLCLGISQVPLDACVENIVELGIATLRLHIWRAVHDEHDKNICLAWVVHNKSWDRRIRLTACRSNKDDDDDDVSESEPVCLICEVPPGASGDLLCSKTGRCVTIEEARSKVSNITWSAELLPNK